MRDLLVLFVHLVVTTVRLMRPGGARAIVAESLLLKQQLPIVTRPRRRAPDLRPLDRVVVGLCGGFLRRARLHRCAIVLKPATILSFQRSLVKRKYRELFSPNRRGQPGPKGPSAELTAAIVEMKRRNPRFGYQRIADQLALAFDVPVDKHLVRRVLAKNCRLGPGSGGPSWLTFLGHSKDSLLSLDLFRCESLILKTHWVMVVMDQWGANSNSTYNCCRIAIRTPQAQSLDRQSFIHAIAKAVDNRIRRRKATFHFILLFQRRRLVGSVGG